MHISDLVTNLGLFFVLITAATIAANKLNYSAIPFLLLLGMFCGPHAPVAGGFSWQLVQEDQTTRLLAWLGVLLMLFYLGLEFSVGKLVNTGRTMLKSGTVYVTLNFLRGLALGWLLFPSPTDALVLAGITGISSSAIITKLLIDLKRTANPETELILGILIFEDIFIALYLSVLSGILLTGQFGPAVLLPGLGTVVALFAVILLLGKRLAALLDARLKFHTAECFTAAVFTLLLLAGIGAEKIHLAEAIGALVLGLLLAETSHHKRIVQMVTPMRDLFGAVFFFTFGMSIDYRVFASVWKPALLLVAATVLGNIIAGLIAARLAGYTTRRSFHVAFTIMARGEFSVILASFAAAAGASSHLPGLAALYVLLLAFISPALAKNSRRFYELYENIKSGLLNNR
ncbi:MAG: cation:proton antiporter [Bacillota bacterium]